MTFKAGDKVKFLNDVGGGTVTRVKQNIIYVESSDGFEIPSTEQELIKVDEVGFGGMSPKASPSGPPMFSFQKKKDGETIPAQQQVPEEIDDRMGNTLSDDESITSENCTLNILLGLIPEKIKGKQELNFKVHLISDCTYRVMFTFSVVKNNFCYGNRAGLLEDDTQMEIAQFSLTELKCLQSFKISCIFYKKGIYLPHEPIIYEYKIDALKMADPSIWMVNDYFEEKAIVINITEESLMNEIEKNVSEHGENFLIQKKQKAVVAKKIVAIKNTSEMEEVDLHIEELVESSIGLSAGEIMDIQMSRFNIALEGAIRSHTKKIIFIHGIGNGKLKYEIRKMLDTSKFSKYRYQDASFQEYGYGATMVILK